MGCGHTFILLGKHIEFNVLWNGCTYWETTPDSCWSNANNNGGRNLKKFHACHVCSLSRSCLDLKASRIYQLANCTSSGDWSACQVNGTEAADTI